MKALEILCVLHGIKPVARQGFYDSEITAVDEFCKISGLFVEKSRDRIEVHGVGYSNVGQRGKHGLKLLYISKDEIKAAQACLFETRQDHMQAGIALGYPRCCAEFFAKSFVEGNLNPVHLPTNPWTNLTQRENDACLLSHFPCHSDCDASVAIARQNFELLSKTDSKTAREIYSALATAQ